MEHPVAKELVLLPVPSRRIGRPDDHLAVDDHFVRGELLGRQVDLGAVGQPVAPTSTALR